jgi:hypothetical protein
VAKKNGCQFAIRSGGHSGVPGASNLADGLVIDLGRLREVTLSADKQSVRAGAGNRWSDVYSRLDPYKVAVVGGRVASVGVGGLTLGGGLSYFSGQYGFACDNVINYEVVLADGSIVNANTDSPQYADLARALRGGTNNFGVVTRFDLRAHPYEGINGGLVVWPETPQVTENVIDAFVSFSRSAPQDPHAHSFLALTGQPTGSRIWAAGLYYTKPYTTPRPSIFDPFYTADLNATTLVSTLRNTNHTDLTNELDKTQPTGPRNRFYTNTYHANAALIRACVSIFREETAHANIALTARGYPNASTSYAMQHLTSNILSPGATKNVLGLSPSAAPLVLISITSPWTSVGEDAIILGSMQRVIERTDALAREKGLAHPFKYANYAQPGAKVFEGYGKANQEFLRRVSRKYDPEGVWPKLVPGGFKLW